MEMHAKCVQAGTSKPQVIRPHESEEAFEESDVEFDHDILTLFESRPPRASVHFNASVFHLLVSGARCRVSGLIVFSVLVLQYDQQNKIQDHNSKKYY